MSIKVEIIQDSVSPAEVRLTTFKLCYPMRIHWDFLTHRALSRNASSTRAIPVHLMADWTRSDPYIPDWTWNRRGMQGVRIDDEATRKLADAHWLGAMEGCLCAMEALAALGVHKQDTNALVMPFGWMNVVATGDQFGWSNFFHLRTHKDANPTFVALAVQMAESYQASVPVERPAHRPHDERCWHLPFITDEEREDYPIVQLCVVATARCARTSYTTFDGRVASFEEDVELYRTKLAGDPIHASPMEHVALAMDDAGYRSGNFQGWLQFRKQHANEWRRSFDFGRLKEVV